MLAVELSESDFGMVSLSLSYPTSPAASIIEKDETDSASSAAGQPVAGGAHSAERAPMLSQVTNESTMVWSTAPPSARSPAVFSSAASMFGELSGEASWQPSPEGRLG